MRRQYPAIALLWLALTQTACAQTAVPADLIAFVDKRDACDHLRGELPDPEEQEQLEAVINDVNQQCKGTDAALQKLKKKYAENASVLQVLNRYEMNIEAP
ncbi:MAG: hypothetical protein JWP80_1040 [Pseudomonas sp.]|nr:hypothetical protein [Pseudomonas sp.]